MATPPKPNMPATRAREAPLWASDPAGFDNFFDDTDDFATRSGLDDAGKIRWACRYAGAESEVWKALPCVANGGTPTFAEFRAAVAGCYPHLNKDTRYTPDELDALIARTSTNDDMTRTDFGAYHRDFLKMSTYLVLKNRLSPHDCNVKYLRGLPGRLRAAVRTRLAHLKPHIRPGDGYDIDDTNHAVTFIFDSHWGRGPLEPVETSWEH